MFAETLHMGLEMFADFGRQIFLAGGVILKRVEISFLSLVGIGDLWF